MSTFNIEEEERKIETEEAELGILKEELSFIVKEEKRTRSEIKKREKALRDKYKALLEEKEKRENPSPYEGVVLKEDADMKTFLSEELPKNCTEWKREGLEVNTEEVKRYFKEREVAQKNADVGREVFALNRRSKGITYSELAKEMGVSTTRCSKIVKRVLSGICSFVLSEKGKM